MTKIERVENAIPAEVKALNASTASLGRLLRRDGISFEYNLTERKVGFAGKKTTLPHCMAIRQNTPSQILSINFNGFRAALTRRVV